ncbi:MAG: ribose-phosphate pyrophosphokinase [Bernardetiaceae bacterium]|nr:ribose-phosphate pyrophosphokinase [Bernardetiaceae bacterium]
MANISKLPRLLFSTAKYNYLKEALLLHEGFESGQLLRRSFPDGEHYYRFNTPLEMRDAVLIGGTISDEDTLELYDLACGLVGYGVRSLTLVMPFFGYSTMERSVQYGEIVTAKTRARLLSSIPHAYYGNKIMLFDLHAAGIEHYFEGTLRRAHVYVKPLIAKAARMLAGSDDFVLASTDAGRAKWIESLARDMNVDPAFVYKRRESGSKTQVTGVNANVKGRKVVIYDDMIRTGGSLLQAAYAYLEAGAEQVFAVATHGLFPDNAAIKLQKSGLLTKMMVTDTHPNALSVESDFINVISIDTLIAENL